MPKRKISTKKANKFQISSDFWKGLAVGVIIVVIGVFVYLKLSPAEKVAPTNLFGNCPSFCHMISGKCMCSY